MITYSRMALMLATAATIAVTGPAATASAASPTAGSRAGGAASVVQPGAAAAPVRAQACFRSGTRIKSPSSSKVYLVDPQGFWDWIPTETDYNNLFASWSGLVVTSDFSCFRDGGPLYNARLVKKSNDPKVYIWDATWSAYRWIPTGDIFNAYHFDWSKIKTQSSISPIGPNWG
jgi:hypothetical protein